MPLDYKMWNDLAVSVVSKAIFDWRCAILALDKDKYNRTKKNLLEDCEEFFLSGECEFYCGVSGRRILDLLKDEHRRGDTKKMSAFHVWRADYE